MVRVWRELEHERMSGQALGIDEYLPTRIPGSMALPCTACPEPGFNLPPDWKEHPDPSVNITQDRVLSDIIFRYVFRAALAIDANFRLQSKEVAGRRDPHDVSLCDGRLYACVQQELDTYLKKKDVRGEKQVMFQRCAS